MKHIKLTTVVFKHRQLSFVSPLYISVRYWIMDGETLCGLVPLRHTLKAAHQMITTSVEHPFTLRHHPRFDCLRA